MQSHMFNTIITPSGYDTWSTEAKLGNLLKVNFPAWIWMF